MINDDKDIMIWAHEKKQKKKNGQAILGPPQISVLLYNCISTDKFLIAPQATSKYSGPWANNFAVLFGN